jgi:hypothetical protein
MGHHESGPPMLIVTGTAWNTSSPVVGLRVQWASDLVFCSQGRTSGQVLAVWKMSYCAQQAQVLS